MELMLFLILSSLLLTARVASDPVLDVDGKELRRGQLYYAGSVMRPGGGLTLASVNGSSCPLNVAQARLIDFKGKPLAFFPEDPDEDIVLQGATLYVMFPEPTQCSESTVWKLESGVVTTGGTKSRSVGTHSSRFAIRPVTGSGYQFMSCPCSIMVPWGSCRRGCSGPLGGVQRVEGGEVLLGSGGTPHTVIFSKVEEGNPTI